MTTSKPLTKKEELILAWHKGWLSSTAKDVLIDMLLNPKRDLESENKESLTPTKHDFKRLESSRKRDRGNIKPPPLEKIGRHYKRNN